MTPFFGTELCAAFSEGKLRARAAFFLEEAICMKCGGDYMQCLHSKWLDDDVVVNMSRIGAAGIFVTDLG